MSSTPQSTTKDPEPNGVPSPGPSAGAETIESAGVDMEKLSALAERLSEVLFEEGLERSENLRLDFRPPPPSNVVDEGQGEEKIVCCDLSRNHFQTKNGQVPILACDIRDTNGVFQGLQSHVVCWELAEDRRALMNAYASSLFDDLKGTAIKLFDVVVQLQEFSDEEGIRTGSIHEGCFVEWSS